MAKIETNSTDILSNEERSERMRAIRSKDTRIERLLGKALWERGLRYRKNDLKVPGKPDFCFRRLKIAVFCDSEFWHGKDWESARNRFRSNQDFWFAKIERNIQRDKDVNRRLSDDGWIVLRFWAKDIQSNLQDCLAKVEQALRKRTSPFKN